MKRGQRERSHGGQGDDVRMSRRVLLPDQLYEDSQTDMTSEDTDEDDDNEVTLSNVYQNELKKIRDNLRAIHTMRQGDRRSSIFGNSPWSGMWWRWKSDEELCGPPTRENIPYATLPRRGRAGQNQDRIDAVSSHPSLRGLSSDLVTRRNRLVTTEEASTAGLSSSSPPSFQPTPEPPTRSGQRVGHQLGAHLDDLVHWSGPLTEDALLRTLAARFYRGQHFVRVGPIGLAINPYRQLGNPLTLDGATGPCPQLLRMIREAVERQAETGYPQSIVLSGECGSGKTYWSVSVLRRVLEMTGGGPETDAFKHLAAALTVLRSLGAAKTSTNSESSRMGHFIELRMTDGALHRTKIHCYFLDQSRVVGSPPPEKNYHIFYQMLAGLTSEERSKLYLDGYSIQNLRYLNPEDVSHHQKEDAARFLAWKTSLSVLGIPFMEVMRVLSAVLLLGNIQFVDGEGLEVEVKGSHEIKPVAALLGVSSVALFKGLTTRTRNIGGQLVKSASDASTSNRTRDALARALYCRTVATVVGRANSPKRVASQTPESDGHQRPRPAADSGSPSAGSTGSAHSSAPDSAWPAATQGFIGILDAFGFEDSRAGRLEHLCLNLGAERLQHWYRLHVFHGGAEGDAEEEEEEEEPVPDDAADGVACIQLLCSPRTGLLAMLEAECSVGGTAESYVGRARAQHGSHSRMFPVRPPRPTALGIRHFAGRVVYDARQFLETNRDAIPDDVVSVFHGSGCSCAMASHLFASELEALYSGEPVPRGLQFRISAPFDGRQTAASSLTADFRRRLDRLLETVSGSRPHFVRCIKANDGEEAGRWDTSAVGRQIRALQVLETLHSMTTGLPHRMEFQEFDRRYGCLMTDQPPEKTEESRADRCRVVLEQSLGSDGSGPASGHWTLGRRHLFFSEVARQRLEWLRTERRRRAAVLLQSTWRGWNFRRRWCRFRTRPPPPTQSGSGGWRTRAGCPPPPWEDGVEPVVGRPRPVDPERAPPVPPSRAYTVAGNTKLGYPQTRVMKTDYTEEGSHRVTLRRGESVLVLGTSAVRGHLVVEYRSRTFHLPYRHLELKPGAEEEG